MENITLFQFFHWYYPNDGSLWKHCTEQAPFLKKLGVKYVWRTVFTVSSFFFALFFGSVSGMKKRAGWRPGPLALLMFPMESRGDFYDMTRT